MKRIDTTNTPGPCIRGSGIIEINEALPMIMEFDPSKMCLLDYKPTAMTFPEEKLVPAIFIDFLLENKELIPGEWKKDPQRFSKKMTLIFTGTVFLKETKKYHNTLEISETGEAKKGCVPCGFSWYGYEVRFN
jgi:hypothetical protein